MTRRRILLAGISSLLACATRVLADQAARKYRVAVLFSMPDVYSAPYRAALIQRLAVHGFTEGSNLTIDTRPATGTGLDREREQVISQLAGKPAAFFTTSTRVTQAALAEARSVPIVFAWISDPVASGVVRDYAQPGGTATGVSDRFYDVAAKRIELLRELLPRAKRLALIGPMYAPELEAAIPRLRDSALQMGFEPNMVDTGYQYPLAAVENAIAGGAQALLPLQNYTALGQRITGEQIVSMANAKRVPVVFAESELVEAGGLMSFGSNLLDDVRRAADMLVKVLRGAKPAELPIDQAARFELVINRRSARQIAVTIPPSLLVRADRVIG